MAKTINNRLDELCKMLSDKTGLNIRWAGANGEVFCTGDNVFNYLNGYHSKRDTVLYIEGILAGLNFGSARKNDVTSFFYYMWNRWSKEECRIAFKDGDYKHFWNKWCEAYDTMHGPRGAAEYFYMMLSDTNRTKLVARAKECYDGMSEKQ